MEIVGINVRNTKEPSRDDGGRRKNVEEEEMETCIVADR